jgi:hypothetical protein
MRESGLFPALLLPAYIRRAEDFSALREKLERNGKTL